MTKFVEDTYAKIAGAYAREFFDDRSDLPSLEKLIKLLPQHGKVLDIGCGPGQFTGYLHDHGFDVEGIDLSDEMLAIARAQFPQLTFAKMDMRRLEYPDTSFDGVLAAYSIIHIPSPELPGVLAEIRRVLKPRGTALFIVQQGEPDQVLDEPLAKGEKIFVNFFSIDRLTSLLSGAGLRVVESGTGHQAGDEVLASEIIYMLATPA
jgi:ubiquinone/menaquinone biosynthesis C-methylase UbiE